MTDLVQRLRNSYISHGLNYVQEAADAIEKLTAERDMLVDALRAISDGDGHANEIAQQTLAEVEKTK